MRIEKAQMMLERYESGDNKRELNEQEEFDEDLISLSTSNSPRNNNNISTASSSLNPENQYTHRVGSISMMRFEEDDFGMWEGKKKRSGNQV